MSAVVRDDSVQGSRHTSMMVVACPVHEASVLSAIIAGDDIDDATLCAVDEAMECPACRLLLALASGNPAFLGHVPGEGGTGDMQNVVPFPAAQPGVEDPGRRATSRGVVVVEDRLAASAGTLCVGREISGRFQFLLRPNEPSDRQATIEVRVGRRTSIGVRWLSGFRVRLRDSGVPLGSSSVTVSAQPGLGISHVLEEILEPIE